MNAFGWFTRLLNRRQQASDDSPMSIVMLQRHTHFFTSAEIEKAGETAWGMPFDGKADPMFFVVQKGAITMVKAGTFAINVIHAGKPYLDESELARSRIRKPEQKRAWLAHTAWVAFDVLNEESDKSEAYATLARFVLGLGDDNCTGIYLPKEHIMMPNDGAAEQGLHMLIRKELLR